MRAANEDRVYTAAEGTCFGICDGHGGANAAQFVSDRLREQLHLQQTSEAVVALFACVNRQLHALLPWDDEYVGTTATAAVLRPGRVLRLVHLGDCRAVLVDAGGMAHCLTVEHSATRLDEASRIQKCGGRVVGGRVNGVLNISRALGDFPLAGVLSCEPDVTDRPLKQSDHLLILGSDGFFDHVSPADAAEAAMRMDPQGTSVVPKDLEQAALDLVQLAVSKGSNDDVSVILIDLRAYES